MKLKTTWFVAAFFSFWASSAGAEDTARFSLFAPPSALTQALEGEVLSRQEWRSTGLEPEFVTTAQPYWVALAEGLVDLAYVPATFAQERAINSVGFSDLLAQPFSGLAPDAVALARDGPLRRFLLAELEHEDAFALSLASLGASSLVTNSPIEELQSVNGEKWALTRPMNRAFAALGVSSQILPQDQMEPALATGSADAVELLFPEDVERITGDQNGLSVLTNFQPIVLVALVRAEYWEALTEDQRLGVESVLARVESQSFDKAEEAIGSLNQTLMERSVKQVVSFKQILDPNLAADLRKDWADRTDGRTLILDLLETSIDRGPGDEEAPLRPQSLPINRGQLPERKIWFATDRERFSNPRGFLGTFGIKYSGNATELFHCGAIRWGHDGTRIIGSPIELGLLRFDGDIIGNHRCIDMLANLVSTGERRALLFIHGYNTKFPAAVARAAALKEDLGWRAPVIIWSWPSKGIPGAYDKDGKAIASSRLRLFPFLRALGSAGFERVDLVTHSMGGRLGTDILAFAGSAPDTPFSRAIFVAPDVTSLDFSVAVSASNFPGRITLYANAHDRALMASMIKNGTSPAGLAGDYSLMMAGLETIDASKIDAEPLPDYNHAHVFDVLEGLADLKARMADDDPAPGQRKLRREPENGMPHRWMIEPDPTLRAGTD